MTARQNRSDELAALAALGALDAAEQAAAERDHGLVPDVYGTVIEALAEAASVSPPAALRAATMARAEAGRPAGSALPAVAPAHPLDTYEAMAASLAALLRSLDEQAWSLPAPGHYPTVRDVVAHLAGIEHLTLGWLGAAPIPDPLLARDHVGVTRETIAALADRPPPEVLDLWLRRVRKVIAAARTSPPQLAAAVHDIPADRDAMLVLRCFELWAHHDDVARAAGYERPELAAQHARLMSARLVASLPAAFLLAGEEPPAARTRLVLTGEGGGTYDIALGSPDPAGARDALVVIDVIELCRLAAARAEIEALDLYVEGDSGTARRVLAAASAFARD